MPVAPKPDSVRIEPRRTLLNPKFEGYKLKVFPDEQLKRYSLESPVHPSKVPSNAKLSYAQIQSRVKYNHLFKGYAHVIDGKRLESAFYVDEKGILTAVVIDVQGDGERLKTTRLFDLTTPGDEGMSTDISAEHYSAVALRWDLLLVADGYGTMRVLNVSDIFSDHDSGDGIKADRALYTFQYSSFEQSTKRIPSVLLDAVFLNSSSIEQSIVYAAYSVSPQRVAEEHHVQLVGQSTSKSTLKPTKPLFDITINKFDVSLSCPASFQPSQSSSVDVLHTLRGKNIPLYFDLSVNGIQYIIASESSYSVILRNPSSEDSEKMDIDHAVGGKEEPAATSDNSVGPSFAPRSPYTWTQKESEVTVVFDIPKGTPKTAISCKFTRTHLSLIVNRVARPPSETSSTQTQQGPFDPAIAIPYKQLWDIVDTDATIWTIDSKEGTLTLNIAKGNEKVRWPQVFAEDDGVAESLTQAQLDEYIARLEKYTQDVDDPASTLATSSYPRSLPQPMDGGDFDDDIDQEGQNVTFSWYDQVGCLRAQSSNHRHEWLCQSFRGSTPEDRLLTNICLKYDLDGLVYQLDEQSGSMATLANHIATFNALAFVQASKREKRFIYTDPQCRFATIIEGSRNAYIYYRHEGSQFTEVQSLIDLTQGYHQDVVGAQLIGGHHLLVLMEQQLVLANLADW